VSLIRSCLVATAIMLAAGAARAATCQTAGSFDVWLGGFKRQAVAQGVSARTVSGALDGITFDPGVISRDRGQRVFSQSFEQFSGRMISRSRLTKGAAMLKQHGALLARIEQRTGVPPAIIVALWGLETDFGAVRGNFPIIRSLATLAYDCRRSAFFTAELMDALRIVDRGDLSLAELRGGWAGELGQTQFLASSYLKYAVDFDGDGRRDLVRSVPDVLASTANYLKGYGWRGGSGWEPGQANFTVLKQWNKSDVYCRTVALFATRLAGQSSAALAH